MRFSDDSNYIAYMNNVYAMNYEAARESLLKCLRDPTLSTPQRTFLLQNVGRTYFFEGNKKKAIEYFVMAEKEDDSLLAKYEFAKFLIRDAKCHSEGIDKCNEIVAAAKSSPFDKSEEDYGSDYYEEEAKKLLAEIG